MQMLCIERGCAKVRFVSVATSYKVTRYRAKMHFDRVFAKTNEKTTRSIFYISRIGGIYGTY